MSPVPALRFRLRSESFTIHRLPPDRPLPAAALAAAAWYTVTRTENELSIVAPAEIALGPSECQTGWSCLQIDAVLDFSLVGILAGVASVLAAAGVSLFAVSSFDTDHILVRTRDVETATAALRSAGHEVAG